VLASTGHEWTGPHRLSLKQDSFRTGPTEPPLGIAVKGRKQAGSRSNYKAAVALQCPVKNS
jgi:hypothetical protein